MSDAKTLSSDSSNAAPTPLPENLEELQQDLQLARELQQAMLPLQYPTFPRGAPPHESALLFHHDYRANSAIGGDFVAILPLSANSAGIFLCDVMGHGVRAALVAAMISALLEESKHLATDPGALLTEINRGLIEILQRTRTLVFTSAFYLVADASSGQMRFANAGHPAPLHAGRGISSDKPAFVSSLNGTPGPVLGMISDATFPTCEQRLAVGDLLLLYTDGLFEVARDGGEIFGQERVFSSVCERLTRTPTLPLRDICNAVIEEAATFGGFEDDVCLVAMEVARLGISGEAGRDDLTGLFNEHYLRESLEREVHRAVRQSYEIGVIALEFRGIEEFSRRHGQGEADEVLRGFGALLTLHTRRSDIACRTRPTGFTLILPEASPDNTQRKAAQLCEVLKSHCPRLFETGELSLMLGLASFPQHGTSGEVIVQTATAAMKPKPS